MKLDGSTIGEDVSLFRGIHYPTAFHDERVRVLDTSKSINLNYNKSTNTIEASVVWQMLAPRMSDVHRYGRRLSAERQARQKLDVYCGVYQVTVARLREKCLDPNAPELTAIDAVHAVEKGELSHANLYFTLAPGINDADLEDVKTFIVDRMWHALRGPVRHVGPASQYIADHPNEKLHDAPGGAYIDERRWHRVACQIALMYVWSACVLLTKLLTRQKWAR